MAHIFVSYKRESLDDVKVFVDELKRHHRVWFDQTGIPGGSQWEEKIATALDEAVTLILMVTPAALDSEWVKHEYKTAQRKGVMVLPYILETATLPDELRGTQAINGEADDAFERVMDALPDSSRIWGETVMPHNKVAQYATLGAAAADLTDGVLYPAAGLVGVPILQSRYCRLYRIGRETDPLEEQGTYQLAVQLTSRFFSLTPDKNGTYKQDDFPASIAAHFLTSPSKQVQLYLIRGPLNQPYDQPTKLSYGLNTARQSEWQDIITVADTARTVATGKTMQLFVNGPAIFSYVLGTSNPGFTRYELYQLDYASQIYRQVFSG